MRLFRFSPALSLAILVAGQSFANGGLVVNGGTGNITISGMLSVTAPTSPGVEVKNRNSGSVNLNGLTTLNTGAQHAVSLTSNNVNHTTTFGGTLDIDTTTGTGVLATSGGTLVSTGAGSSVVSTGGPALSLSSTTIGGAGANFGTVSSTNSPTRGVYLASVGGGLLTTTGGSITGAAGIPVEVTAGTVSMTFGGSITQAANNPMVRVAVGHTTGTLTFQTGTLNASAGTGLQFDNADGTYNFNGTTTLNGGDAGIDILNGSGGGFSFGTGASITSPTGIPFVVNGGTASSTYSGAITQANNAALVSVLGGHNTGTIAFQTGTLLSTNGTGVQLDNADGTYNFIGTTTLAGGDAGIDILNGSGGTFSFGTGASISNPSGTAFNVNSGNPSITYSGGITQTTIGQRVANIDGTTGNTVAFNTGTITGGQNSTGINLNNANGNVTFANLNLGTSGARATNQAVTINGGTGTYGLGAVSIFTNNAQGIVATNADGTLNATSGTVDTTNNRAINIDGPAGLTTLGMTLTKVSSSNSASTGISLLDTNGTFTIAGTGSAASGGTIANAPTGISLTTVQGISINDMQLNDFGDFAIRGSGVVGFNMDSTVINGTNGNDAGADEGSIRFTGLTGSASITNSNISGAVEDNFAVVNTSGTLNRLTLDTVTIGANSTTTGGDSLFVETQGTAVINVTVQNSFFTSSRGDLLQFTQGSSGSMDAVITGTAFSDNHPAIVSGGGGVVLGGTAGSLTFNVNGNTFRDSTGTGLAVSSGNAGQSTVGRIENNQVGVAGIANSGSTGGSGIAVVSSGGGTLTALVNNNQVRQYNNHGILLQAGQTLGNPTSFDVAVTNNTVANPGNINTNFNGIHLNNGTVPGENFTACVDIRTNTIAGSGTGAVAPNNADYRLRQRQSTTVRLPGYGGANNNDAAVVAFVSGNQTTVTTGAASNTVGSGGGGFIGGASCVAVP